MRYSDVALNVLAAFLFSQCHAEITINQVNQVPALPREDVDLKGFREFPALYETEVVLPQIHDEVRISSELYCRQFLTDSELTEF